MKKELFLLFILALPLLVRAQSAEELEEFARQQKKEQEELRQAREKGLADLAADYEKYVKAETEAYAAFRKEVEAKWGKGNVAESSNKEWVEYSKDRNSRSMVDFENGVAKIEVILDNQEVKNPQLMKRKVEDEVARLIESKGTTKDYDTEYEKKRELTDKPVLNGQINTPDGKKVTEDNLTQAAKEIVGNGKPEVKTIQGEDGEERKVVVFSLPLAPDHIRVRAEKYKAEVEQYAKKYKLDPALVYAVMHTESYFNPKARSHVPAFGLMQIVPGYAGKDAYQYVYGKNSRPTANYLYDPKNNIELGTAYLYMLCNRSFQKIKDEDCRLLCAIAAYNTGAGNVSRAFIGTTRLGNAIPEINRYGYSDLYAYMSRRLPAQETRDYIRKVTERMEQYKKWRDE